MGGDVRARSDNHLYESIHEAAYASHTPRYSYRKTMDSMRAGLLALHDATHDVQLHGELLDGLGSALVFITSGGVDALTC